MAWIPDGESAAAPVPLRASALTDPVAYVPQNPDWSLTDGEWSALTTAEGDTLALHEGDPYGFAALSPGVHEARARLRVTAVTQVHVDVTWRSVDGAEYVMSDGPAETIPAGEWGTLHRTWEAPAGAVSGSIAFRFQASPGNTVRVRDLVWAAHDVDAPVVIVADQIIGGHFTGETFEGGAFVGGEFRTSDTLPGQVTLSDTANQGAPGISIEPADDAGYDVLPSIGPGPDDMRISGGVSTAGAMSGAQFSASGTNIYHNSPGETGAGSWVVVNGAEARVAYRPDRTNIAHESGVWVRPGDAMIFSEDESGVGTVSATGAGASVSHYPVAGQGDHFSSLSATATAAMLSMSAPDGTARRLRVDGSGVWADIGTGPHAHNYTSYNLFDLISRVNDLEARVAALEA